MKNTFSEIFFKPTRLKRTVFFIIVDALSIIFALKLSFLIRFDFYIPTDFVKSMFRAMPLFVVVKLSIFWFFGLYRITWRFFSVNDVWNVFLAAVLSALLLIVAVMVPLGPNYNIVPYINIKPFPRSIFLLDAVLTFFIISFVRGLKRFYLEIVKNKKSLTNVKRAIILGAGNTGEMIVRDMTRQDYIRYYPVAVLDDDSDKHGSSVHGIRVEGPISNLKDCVRKYDAQAVIIAIPHLDHKTLKNIHSLVKEANVQEIKIVPRIYDVQHPAINVKRLEEIGIEDLIGRQIIAVDMEAIESFIRGRTVLITGAGGSIGSELSLQVARCGPSRLILLDVDETDLHNLELKLKTIYAASAVVSSSLFSPEMSLPNRCAVSFVVADIRDQHFVGQIFAATQPDLIFHAAAYKHVPMMEYNPQEAVKVNMFGTRYLAEMAVKYRAKKFIMISTDKAVRPTSVMGATKRLAEDICKAYNSVGNTEFVSVRFGNVLGSRGSVLPIFLDQIKNGGPLTVTHKDMVRYFMTIHEAVSLVLQASVLGNGGDVMVLDMGEPVKILDLAEELIRIHGLVPYKDIEITFTGIRPGEKLFEEILTSEEGTVASRHEKIFIANDTVQYSRDDIEKILLEFSSIVDAELGWSKNVHIRSALKRYVKHFQEKEPEPAL